MKTTTPAILMGIFIVLLILIVVSASLIFYIIITSFDTQATIRNDDVVSIASWNLQDFGTKKAANTSLLEFYAQKLTDHDVFIIQEIRDPTAEAIHSLASYFPDYRYILSQPAGQGSSKEQYAIFYNAETELLHTMDWTEQEQSAFERPPLEATFKIKNWTFTLYTIHIKVDNVAQELTNLEQVIGTPVNDSILIGDLNADGDNYYHGVLHHFLDWHWLITSTMDTTVAKSSNALDRIVINNGTENNFITAGIMNEVTASQSDHYLVYALFNPQEP